MAKANYAVIGGAARKIKRQYAVINGVTRKIKKVYEVINGETRICWTSGYPAGEVALTQSGIWNVPEGIKSIDIFAVGGGGGAGGRFYQGISFPGGFNNTENYGCNGGYGYTASAKNISVTPGEPLAITIGAGGSAGEEYLTVVSNGEVTYQKGTQTTDGGQGGSTSVSRNGTIIVSAKGGSGGTKGTTDHANVGTYIGAAGGSGSSCSNRLYRRQDDSNNYTYSVTKGADGFDGNDGAQGVYSAYDLANNRYIQYDTPTGIGGKGQGTTTRKFGESGNTLYASRTITAPNTGTNGRSQGVYSATNNNDADNGGIGGSGVVIIRWAAQED